MKHVFIIAEAGVNHNGSLRIAKRMVTEAAEAGADAIKFQTFRGENMVCKTACKAKYQLQMTEKAETQLEMLQKLELTENDHQELWKCCKNHNIQFLSAPFDLESIELLDHLGILIYKIPSGEITNYPYLERVGMKKRTVILSTGMSTMQEVKDAVRILQKNGTEKVILLHCNTEYPTPMQDVNLLAMKTMKRKLQLPVGYSDHTLGIEVSIAAVALGAEIIEKHFTLDKRMKGSDHHASLEPAELKNMVRAIRNIEYALGSGEKKPSSSEKKNIQIVRKSIVAGQKIAKGELLSERNITTKRPGDGISPMRWKEVIGRTAEKNYEKDEPIVFEEWK